MHIYYWGPAHPAGNSIFVIQGLWLRWGQVTSIMLPLLKFYFHEEVRQAAAQAIPDLLRSAYLAAQKGVPGADLNYVKRMADFIWGPLMEAIGKVGWSAAA
jgi:hypothetical protein